MFNAEGDSNPLPKKPFVGVNRHCVQSRGYVDGIGIKHQSVNHHSDNAKGGSAGKDNARNGNEFTRKAVPPQAENQDRA